MRSEERTSFHYQQHDIIFKHVLAEIGVSVAELVIEMPIKKWQRLPVVRSSMGQKEFDHAFEIITADDQSYVLLVVLQSFNDPDMHLHMLQGVTAIYRHHDDKPVIPLVVYLGAEPLSMISRFEQNAMLTSLIFEYQLFAVNDQNPQRFLDSESPNIVILAVLASTDDLASIIHEVLQKLRRVAPQGRLSDLLLKLDVLCQLREASRLLATEVKRMVVEVDLKQLVTYQLGKEEGLKEGLKEGLLMTLEAMFGKNGVVQEELEHQIKAIDDLPTLQALTDLIRMETTSLEDIKQFLSARNVPHETS